MIHGRKQTDDVGAHRVGEPGIQLFADRRAAEHVAAFEDEHLASRLRQVGGARTSPLWPPPMMIASPGQGCRFRSGSKKGRSGTIAFARTVRRSYSTVCSMRELTRVRHAVRGLGPTRWRNLFLENGRPRTDWSPDPTCLTVRGSTRESTSRQATAGNMRRQARGCRRAARAARRGRLSSPDQAAKREPSRSSSAAQRVLPDERFALELRPHQPRPIS